MLVMCDLAGIDDIGDIGDEDKVQEVIQIGDTKE